MPTAAPALPISTQPRPPGWYRDPARRSQVRWWDGTGWTGRILVRQRPAPDSARRVVSAAAISLAVAGTSFGLSALFVISAGRSAVEPVSASSLAGAVGILAVVHLVIGLVLFPLVAFATAGRKWVTVLWSVLGAGAGLVTGLVFGFAASMNGQELC